MSIENCNFTPPVFGLLWIFAAVYGMIIIGKFRHFTKEYEMERYIYINYAYEDYEYVQKIIEDIEKTGVKVCHGNGSEERVQAVCVSFISGHRRHTLPRVIGKL